MKSRRCPFASPFLPVLVLLLLSTGRTVYAQATIQVTTTSDNQTAGDGQCTLREALTNANNNTDSTNGDCAAGTSTGVDLIDLIPDAVILPFTRTFSPTSNLPAITDPISISGELDDECTAAIPNRGAYAIMLDGSQATHGLRLASGSDGSTIRGLNIRNFGTSTEGSAITISGSDNHVIECNFIGTDETGLVDQGNTWGILFYSNTENVTIGGTSPGQGNLISGNTLGIDFAVANNHDHVVQGNYIGTDKTGTTAIGNQHGINVQQSDGNLIGGVSEGAGNLVSGNSGYGMVLVGVSENVIQGNTIGADVSGSAPLANDVGIDIAHPLFTRPDVVNNLIGGEGGGNTVAFNTEEGIAISRVGGTVQGNMISANSVFSNGALGIDLKNSSRNSGVTNNDAGDGDGGVNLRQNYPVLTSAEVTGDLMVTYSVDTAPENATYPLRVEFFLADSDSEEGATYLGFDEYSEAEAQTTVTGAFTPAVTLSDGDVILATATDADGNTSEFSTTTATVTQQEVTVAVGLWLEGPFNGTDMTVALSSVLPETDPYFGTDSVEADFFSTSPGSEVIDWVWLALRTGDPASPPMTTVAETAALLMSDGTVKAVDATSAVPFTGVAAGSFYLVVGHRNHLAVMSASALDCSSGSCSYAFGGAQTQAYGGSAMTDLGSGVFGLYAGDGTGNGQVQNDDKNGLWSSNVGRGTQVPAAGSSGAVASVQR